MHAQHSALSYLNAAEANRYVIFLTPDRACWQCEGALPAAPLAVVAKVGRDDYAPNLVFLACSVNCRQQICDEPALAFTASETLSADATSSVLRCGYIQAVVEGWLVREIGWFKVLTGPLAVRHARSLVVVIQ